MTQILIIEDEVLLAKSLARSLTGKGYECLTAHRAEDGLKILDKIHADLALVDLQLPGMSGFEAMKYIRQHDPDIAIIVITAFGTMASVVEAMRSGAADFLRKPIDTDELAMAIERALANVKLKHTVDYYRSREIEKTDVNKLIDFSSRMREVTRVLEKLIETDLPRPSDFPPVLITGETGTGKDLVARNTHFRGKFSDRPFVEVNCSSLPKGLEEAELFGYEKGAFTGADRLKRGLIETADGGTIFLNEIGDLIHEAQVKLLQVIEKKCIRRVGGLRDINVDVRIIAASNRNLEDKGIFREDLFHRLNSVRLDIPPLRRRLDDIIPMAELFLEQFNRKYNTNKKLSARAAELLLKYDWPGNARELRYLMERVSFLLKKPLIEPEDLGIAIRSDRSGSRGTDPVDGDENSNDETDLGAMEKKLILRALNAAEGNVSRAARKLNIGREALRYRMKKHNIISKIEFKNK